MFKIENETKLAVQLTKQGTGCEQVNFELTKVL